VYKAKRKELKQASEVAYNWIKNCLYKQGRQCVLSKDEGRHNHYCILLKSFNGVLKRARDYQYKHLLPDIFLASYFLSYPSRKDKDMKITFDTKE